MREFFDGFILSITFFTKLPISYQVKKITDQTYKYLALSIPLNGLILASLTILFYHLLSPFANDLYVALLASVFYLFMYGFLHLEAVSDIIDAYYGSHGGKDVHKIIKDPHVGALGVISTFCLVIVKVAAFSYLLVKENYLGIFAVLFISRMVVVLVIYLSEFHKESKFIASLKEPLDQKSISIFLLLSFVVLVLFAHVELFFISALVTFIAQKWLLKHIGFLNGDGLGFMIEVNEIVLLNFLIFTLL